MWTDKKTVLFAERNEDNQLVVGRVVIDDMACFVLTYNNPLGQVVKEERPIYREIIKSKVLTEGEEEYYLDILENEDPWYDTEDRAILYFLEGTPLPSQERSPVIVEPSMSWLDRLLSLFGRQM